MTDSTNWRAKNVGTWRGWWDLPGWFSLFRDFGLRGGWRVIQRYRALRDAGFKTYVEEEAYRVARNLLSRDRGS